MSSQTINRILFVGMVALVSSVTTSSIIDLVLWKTNQGGAVHPVLDLEITVAGVFLLAVAAVGSWRTRKP